MGGAVSSPVASERELREFRRSVQLPAEEAPTDAHGSLLPAPWQVDARNAVACSDKRESPELELSGTRLGNGRFSAVFVGRRNGVPLAMRTIHAFRDPEMYGLEGPFQSGRAGRAAGYALRELVEIHEEVAALAQIEHPHIVAFAGIGMTYTGGDAGEPLPAWIFTEYCPTTLHDRIHGEGKGSEDFMADVEGCTAQVISALAYLHAGEYAHADVRPCNIFFDQEGRLKLGDLGVKAIGDWVCEHAPWGVQGLEPWQWSDLRPGYLAPEGGVGPAQDVYAWGVCVVEMVLKEVPVLSHEGRQRQFARAEEHPEVVASCLLALVEENPAHRPTALQVGSHLEGTGRTRLEKACKASVRKAVEVIIAFQASAAVQEAGCHALRRMCCRDQHMAEKLGDVGGIEAVLSGMRTHVYEREVQAAAVACLAVVVCHERAAARFVQAGGVEAAVNAMDVHQECRETQRDALALLTAACLHTASAAEQIDADAIASIVIAMRFHPNCDQVQGAGCWALSELCRQQAVARVCENGGVEAIVAAMCAHPEIVDVQDNGCWALSSIGPTHGQEAVAAGACEAILSGMAAHVSNEEVQTAACWALSDLANHKAGVERIEQYGGRMALENALKAHPGVGEQARAALKLLGEAPVVEKRHTLSGQAGLDALALVQQLGEKSPKKKREKEKQKALSASGADAKEFGLSERHLKKLGEKGEKKRSSKSSGRRLKKLASGPVDGTAADAQAANGAGS